MDYNILIGGAAGQGVESLAYVLEWVLKRKGFHTFTVRDYMSRVRGGHNFIQVRFSDREITSHRDNLDVILALNAETVGIHYDRLDTGGLVICDDDLNYRKGNLMSFSLKTAAKNAGNVKTMGSAALGVLLKLLGLDLSKVDDVMGRLFKDDILSQNLTAVEQGFELASPGYDVKTPDTDGNILINGNEAIALGALAAGCRFYSAYPMTPSTSIMNYVASKMQEAEVVVEQAEDEIAAINMAIGASYAGVRAMTGTSGGGFALMVEGLGLSGMMEIPLVVAEIQRPGPTTGFPTRTEQGDLKFVISASQGEFPRMVIAPRSPEDAFYQTVRAFNLADKYRIPVIILGDQYLADTTRTTVPFNIDNVEINRYFNHNDFSGDREYKTYEITDTGVSPRIIPGKLPGKTVVADSDEHDEYGHITESAEMRIIMNEKRMKKLQYLKQELQEPDFLGDEGADILLVAWGSMYGPIKEALELLNAEGDVRYGALVFGDIWPLPQIQLEEKARKANAVYNVEQNATGQLAQLIAEQTGIRCSGSMLKYDGRPLSAQEIYGRLTKGVERNG